MTSLRSVIKWDVSTYTPLRVFVLRRMGYPLCLLSTPTTLFLGFQDTAIRALEHDKPSKTAHSEPSKTAHLEPSKNAHLEPSKNAHSEPSKTLLFGGTVAESITEDPSFKMLNRAEGLDVSHTSFIFAFAVCGKFMCSGAGDTLIKVIS